jgi:hypothetical protein
LDHLPLLYDVAAVIQVALVAPLPFPLPVSLAAADGVAVDSAGVELHALFVAPFPLPLPAIGVQAVIALDKHYIV